MTTIFANIQVSDSATKEYRLMYMFGAWSSKCTIYAESDSEAIFDADAAFKSSKLREWEYGVALFCGDRMVKRYR